MKTLSERHRQFAIRAARWALLGALAGAVAWGLAWLYYRSYWQLPRGVPVFQVPLLSPIPILLLPGSMFGIFAGFELWRNRLATGRQAQLLIAISIVSWACCIAIVLAVTIILDIDLLPITLALGGTVWGAVQASGIAGIFRFARRRRLWLALTAVGGISAWVAMLIVAPDASQGFVLLSLWTSWYATHAAILSTALPLNSG